MPTDPAAYQLEWTYDRIVREPQVQRKSDSVWHSYVNARVKKTGSV